jgi:hypothetical protein
VAEEGLVGERLSGVTEGGVQGPAAGVLVAPRDRMVLPHRAALIGRLVDTEQDMNVWARVRAEGVPLVIPGPGLAKVAGRRVGAVLNDHCGRLKRRMLVEPGADQAAEPRPLIFGSRGGVDAEPGAAGRQVAGQRFTARVVENLTACRQEDNRRVPGQSARAEGSRILSRVSVR